MNLVALTGGIAAGKSTIARRLTEHGAHLIDADALAREVVQPGEPTLDHLVDAFGEGILTDAGALNREALGALVFDDPNKLAILNGITHPAIRERGKQKLRNIREQDPDAIIVYDIPLLVESDDDREWDAVIVAEAPDEMRIERLVTLRGMSEEDARARLASQASNEQRRAVADFIIDTSGTVAWTIEQADRVWEALKTNRSRTQ